MNDRFPDLNALNKPLRNPATDQLDQLNKTAEAIDYKTKMAAAASIAGGLIAASGRPHSMEEAMNVLHDCFWAMWPDPNYGRYKQWAAREDRLTKLYD